MVTSHKRQPAPALIRSGLGATRKYFNTPRVALLAILGMASLPSAMAAPFQPRENPVRAEFISEHTSIQPGGPTRVGVRFHMDEGWHIYAEEPGDAGLPTTVLWKASPDVKFGPMQWPPHETFLDPGHIKTFGYRGTLGLASQITFTPPLDGKYAPVEISAQVEWLACKEICIPGKTDLQLTLPISPTTPELSPQARLFTAAGQ